MYCPKCGKPDQSPETYCRQCGVFLADLGKITKSEAPPEENIRVNTVLSLMTVICCFVLAALLYILLGFRENTHPLIYATASLLVAMGAWHIQTFIRSRKLRKQWKRRVQPNETAADKTAFGSASTDKLLAQPDFENMVPASVTDHTTKHLAESKVRSS